MREGQIRAALAAWLNDLHADDPRTLIRQELGLCAGERRVDLAVINGELTGFEIKSDQDTLARLAGQAQTYGRVLDRVTIVTTSKYLAAAARSLPDWWGIMRAFSDASAEHEVGLELVRETGRNCGQDAFAVAQLLWRDEALDVLRARGLHQGLLKKRRWIVWRHLAEQVPLEELAPIVRDRLRARSSWPGGQ